MHLSQRRSVNTCPTPHKPDAPRRTRTSSLNSINTRNSENHHHYKKIRTRNLSVSASSTEDRRVIPPSSIAADSVTESYIALPKARYADGATDTNSSLPSIAASPQIAHNRNFVFMYDEAEKKSKAVKPSDELNISLPVLVQYELTEDENGSSKPGQDPPGQIPAGDGTTDATDTVYLSPTVELLQKRDTTEKRNRGLHVMRWLVQVQH